MIPTGPLNMLNQSVLKAQSARSSALSESREREELIFQIRQSAQIQAERVQAIVDGAVLAVEQIQDKRIDLLEQGPEVSASDLVFDLLLGFCLGQVAARILKPITESIVGNVIKTAAYYGKLPNSSFGKVLATFGRFASAEFEQRAADLKVKDIRAYNQYLRELLTSAATERAAGLVDTATDLAQGGGPKTRRVVLEVTDTPGVAILAAAQSYASGQRTAIALHHDGLEAAVRIGLNAEQTRLVRQAVTWSPLQDEIIAIRDKYKLMFEAVIWAKLFGFDENTSIRAAGWPVKTEIELPGVAPELMKYWRRRFARVIEQWFSGLLTKWQGRADWVEFNERIDLKPLLSPGRTPQILGNSFEKQDEKKQATDVNRFFIAVARDLTSLSSEGFQVTKRPEAK